MEEKKQSLEERLTKTEAGKRILARMDDEEAMAALERLLGKMDQVSEVMDDLSTLSKNVPSYSAIALDSFDDLCRIESERGCDMATRLEETVRLLSRLTHPGTLKTLNTLLDFTERLPGYIGMSMDIFDEQAAFLEKSVEEDPVRIHGIRSLRRALRHEDFSNGLGILIQLVKELGRSIPRSIIYKT